MFKYVILQPFALPLSRKQAIALFKLYDKKNAGEIIYDNLINEIVGNLSDERKYLINLAYDKISGGKEAININVIPTIKNTSNNGIYIPYSCIPSLENNDLSFSNPQTQE